MRDVAAGGRSRLSPLGLSLDIEADDKDLLALALDRYSRWHGAVDLPRRASLRLSIHSGDAAIPAGACAVRVEANRLFITGPGLDAMADAGRYEARCTIPAWLLAQPERLTGEVLDTLLLFLLTRAGRVPVHASAFLLDDVAVLLAGPSGSGKSCLALAAMQAGFPLLSDDTVYVQLEPRLRIWGLPGAVHVFPQDAPVGEDRPLRFRGGRLKMPVPPPDGELRAIAADRAVLCVLAHGKEVGLEALEADEVEACLGEPAPGFDLLRAEVSAAVAAVTHRGAWRLTLSRDPREAIALIVDSFSSLRKRAA